MTTQAGHLFFEEDDAAGGRCRRARRGRFAATPRAAPARIILSPRLLFPCSDQSKLPLSPLLPRLPLSSFRPDHGIISLKAHGGEGTTKEERLPYEATVYVPPRASSHPLSALLFSLDLSFSPSTVSGRTRQVCPFSLPSACALHSLSVRLSSSTSLSRARARSISFLLRVCRSLVTFALVRSPHRRVWRMRCLVPLFARSARRRRPRTLRIADQTRVRRQEKRAEQEADRGLDFDPARADSNYGESTCFAVEWGLARASFKGTRTRNIRRKRKPDKGAML